MLLRDHFLAFPVLKANRRNSVKEGCEEILAIAVRNLGDFKEGGLLFREVISIIQKLEGPGLGPIVTIGA